MELTAGARLSEYNTIAQGTSTLGLGRPHEFARKSRAPSEQAIFLLPPPLLPRDPLWAVAVEHRNAHIHTRVNQVINMMGKSEQ